MIEAKEAKTLEERLVVRRAMPTIGNVNGLCVYGIWEDGECVGGMWLAAEYPHRLGVEFKCNSYYLIKAVAEIYSAMFRLVPMLTASIECTNHRSLRIAKIFGFRKVYIEGTTYTVELTPQLWRFKDKHPLDLDVSLRT